jgi:hypothetical protein
MGETTVTQSSNATGPGEPTDAVLTLESPDGGQPCAVCPHPWSDHDSRDVRFCTATAASSSTRGCICR